MSHRLWVVCVCAVSFLTVATLTQGQNVSEVGGLAPVPGHHPVYQHSAAYQDGGSASHYVYAPTPKTQDNGQQQTNGTQAQGQNGTQTQGTNGTQNQSQNQTQPQTQNSTQNNQGQTKEEAPPEKPQYLTYSTQKKSLEEQAKSGKTLAVDFKSAPAGATITVDGYFVGNTPATAQIPVGKHLVSVTKWGYDTWSKELDINNGKDLSVNPTLHKDW
ncbi:MAG TPA: PEGA domain-containing protein [Terriglobia bacterium]|nr:PEGA domain-containing protein [Terriglobia bacterium]